MSKLFMPIVFGETAPRRRKAIQIISFDPRDISCVLDGKIHKSSLGWPPAKDVNFKKKQKTKLLKRCERDENTQIRMYTLRRRRSVPKPPVCLLRARVPCVI